MVHCCCCIKLVEMLQILLEMFFFRAIYIICQVVKTSNRLLTAAACQIGGSPKFRLISSFIWGSAMVELTILMVLQLSCRPSKPKFIFRSFVCRCCPCRVVDYFALPCFSICDSNFHNAP